MANTLNKFQTQPFTGWSPSITKANHIGQLFGLKAQQAANFMVQLHAANYGKTLEYLLSQFPTKEFEDDSPYTWELIANSRRNVSLKEARATINGAAIASGNTMIGANKTPFYLAFGESYFYDGEIIVGNYNELYPLRVLGDPIEEGTLYLYKVECWGNNMDGIPADRLQAGEKFSTEFAPVEQGLSRKVGGIHFATPSSMRNEWTTIRLTHKASGDMFNKKVAMGVPVLKEVNGKTQRSVETMWMHHVDFEFERTFSDYKNNALAWGTSNRNNNGEYMDFGKSGDAIRTGSGLFEQCEGANTHYYNTFSLSLLEEILYGLSYGKVDFGKRTFLLKTGEGGAIQFHKAVTQEVSGWQVFTVNGDALGAIKKASAPFTGATQGLAAGFQFVEYYAPNGIHVKLDVDPFYDDPVRNKILINGKPAMSYRYDLFDLGTSNEPNIFKCAIKNLPEARGYQWGPFTNPFTGQANNPYASFDEDGAVIHKKATFGICVLDPTKTAHLIPNVLVG